MEFNIKMVEWQEVNSINNSVVLREPKLAIYIIYIAFLKFR